MVRIGLVGVGFMGWIHYLGLRKVKGAELGAVCSRDPKKLAGDWRGIRGNFGPPGEVVDLKGVNTYAAFDELLGDPRIDLVDVCTPTHQHADMAVRALRAGKHVLVEKAIGLTTDEADVMVKEAKKAGKLLMVAHVLPFFAEFAYAAQVVRQKTYGSLLGGHFRRIISKPDWSGDIADAAKTGGPAVDLHVHDTHFIGLIAGIPAGVFSTGVVESGVVTYLTTQYLYGPGGPALTCSSGAISQKGRAFTHGYELYLDKATLVYEAGQPLTVLTADGKSERPALPGGGDPTDAFTAEIQAAVDGVASGQEPDLLRGQLARDALVLCFKEIQSVQTGKPVAVA